MVGVTASRDSPVSVELSSDISISSSSLGGIPACLSLSESVVAWKLIGFFLEQHRYCCFISKKIIQIYIYLVILAGKETICSLWEWFHFIATLNSDIVILQSFISETVNETLHNLAQSNLQFLFFLEVSIILKSTLICTSRVAY